MFVCGRFAIDWIENKHFILIANTHLRSTTKYEAIPMIHLPLGASIAHTHLLIYAIYAQLLA